MSSTSEPILLVDDNPDVVEVVRVLLESEGYTVTTAGHGADALAQLRSGLRPCLIILDLTMPVMDGWQFREEQLADAELSRIPTILYSAVGSLSSDTVAAMRVAGAFEKGGDFTALLRLIAKICRGS